MNYYKCMYTCVCTCVSIYIYIYIYEVRNGSFSCFFLVIDAIVDDVVTTSAS